MKVSLQHIRSFLDKLWIHHARQYTPKFMAGDIIINRFKDKATISMVVEVQLFENRFEAAYAAQVIGQYKLRNMYSEHGTGANNNRYVRTQYIQKVDPYYDKINPDTAQILYGIKINGGRK